MARIVRLTESGGVGAMSAEIDAIFFANAATQRFESEAAHAAYRDLWLGRYLRHFPEMCFIAFDGEGRVSGYLVGSPVSSVRPLPGPDYYSLFPHELIDAHPAHLHVNVREDCRKKSIGAELIRAFRIDCEKHAIPGLHAITAAGGRAAHFFLKNGLAPAGRARWQGRHIVFMAEALVDRH